MGVFKGLTMVALGAVVVVSGCGRWHRGGVFSSKAQACMARAMYFESNQSSRDGMIAVGSVVMNRVASPEFPDDVCAVVGQPGQFAPGVMSRRMTDGAALARVREAAAAVLAGERHPDIQTAKYFHAAYYHAGYNNMQYVLTTGGNAFYERVRPDEVTQPRPLPATEGVTG
jgi:spore germination cell wall hydrolase CwlJ-like protein